MRFDRQTLRFSPIGAGEEGDRVDEFEGDSGFTGSIRDLEKAAGVRGGDNRGPGLVNMAEFALKELVRHLGLGDVVDSGTATAPV